MRCALASILSRCLSSAIVRFASVMFRVTIETSVVRPSCTTAPRAEENQASRSGEYASK